MPEHPVLNYIIYCSELVGGMRFVRKNFNLYFVANVQCGLIAEALEDTIMHFVQWLKLDTSGLNRKKPGKSPSRDGDVKSRPHRFAKFFFKFVLRNKICFTAIYFLVLCSWLFFRLTLKKRTVVKFLSIPIGVNLKDLQKKICILVCWNVLILYFFEKLLN